MADVELGALRVLPALHYITPLVVLAGFYLITAAAARPPRERPSLSTDKIKPYLTVGLLLGVNATLVAQLIPCFRSLAHSGNSPGRDYVTYLLLSVTAYGYSTLDLLKAATPSWYPMFGASLLAMTLELAVTVLQSYSMPGNDRFAFGRLLLQTAKSAALIGCCLSTGWYLLEDQLQESPDDNALATNTNEDEDRKLILELKDLQRKRLSRGWMNYLKDYKIFFSLVWPSNNRFLQVCMSTILVVLIGERFLNFLVPRQLGIITDHLTRGDGIGASLWGPVVTWMVLSYLDSSAGIVLVRLLADVPLQQFTYKSIRAAVLKHILGLSMDYHFNKSTAELLKAIGQGENMQELLDAALFEMLPRLVDVMLAFGYTLTFGWDMACALVIVGVAYIYAGFKTAAWTMEKRRRYHTKAATEYKVLNEAIENWETVTIFNRAQHELDRYSDSVDSFSSSQIDFFAAHFAKNASGGLVLLLGRLTASGLAIQKVSEGRLTIGNLIALLTYWSYLEGLLRAISDGVRSFTLMLTDAERLLQVLQKKPAVADSLDAVEITVRDGNVEFDNVHFSYDMDHPVLKGITFSASSGQTIGLVGKNGSGKSTILKLIYRLSDVSGGAIRIDGRDIREVTVQSLRDALGMVPQSASLFNDTIMNNVRYGRLNATDEEVKAVCRSVAIHDAIEAHDDGYQRNVGDGGKKLSGGELQRIAMARALLRQPKILLLDEATSEIDPAAEPMIQRAFQELSAGRTTFIVAHKLSTVQYADVILVLDDGQIVERGTHDELLRAKGVYHNMWYTQFKANMDA